MVDPKSVQDLQTQIDKVHTNLDRLSPSKSKSPNTAVSGFASLVLETRLPANHQLKQQPSTSLVQAVNTVPLPLPLPLPLPVFEIHIQPVAIEQLPRLPESMMLSNLTQSIHSDDAWTTDKGLAGASSQPPIPSTLESVIAEAAAVEIVVNDSAVCESIEPESVPLDMATEPVSADGSVDWRILWLFIALLSLPAVMLGRSLLYPSQMCHGVGQLERKWTPQGSDKPATLLNEESVALSHSIQFSPSQVWVDGQRFPFYKELSQTSHAAETTASGVKGTFNVQGIAKTRYAFVYDHALQELRIDVQSSGMGSLEGKVGSIEENTSFIGRCSSQWF